MNSSTCMLTTERLASKIAVSKLCAKHKAAADLRGHRLAALDQRLANRQVQIVVSNLSDRCETSKLLAA